MTWTREDFDRIDEALGVEGTLDREHGYRAVVEGEGHSFIKVQLTNIIPPDLNVLAEIWEEDKKVFTCSLSLEDVTAYGIYSQGVQFKSDVGLVKVDVERFGASMEAREDFG